MTIDLTYEEVRLLLLRSLAAVDSLRESFQTIESLKSHALHHDTIHAVVVLRHAGLDTFGTDRIEVLFKVSVGAQPSLLVFDFCGITLQDPSGDYARNAGQSEAKIVTWLKGTLRPFTNTLGAWGWLRGRLLSAITSDAFRADSSKPEITLDLAKIPAFHQSRLGIRAVRTGWHHISFDLALDGDVKPVLNGDGPL